MPHLPASSILMIVVIAVVGVVLWHIIGKTLIRIPRKTSDKVNSLFISILTLFLAITSHPA